MSCIQENTAGFKRLRYLYDESGQRVQTVSVNKNQQQQQQQQEADKKQQHQESDRQTGTVNMEALCKVATLDKELFPLANSLWNLGIYLEASGSAILQSRTAVTLHFVQSKHALHFLDIVGVKDIGMDVPGSERKAPVTWSSRVERDSVNSKWTETVQIEFKMELLEEFANKVRAASLAKDAADPLTKTLLNIITQGKNPAA